MKYFSLALLSALASCTTSGPSAPPAEYKVTAQWHIGGDGRWDYLTLDPQAHRLYVPRSTRVMVLNTDNGAVIGEVPNTPGIHGVALAPALGRGFTSNGTDRSVTVFDLKTLQTLGTVKAGDNPDAILYDPASQQVFVFNGASQDATVLLAATDPGASPETKRVALGGKPEFAVADGAGSVYVNIEDTNEVVRIDTKTLAVTARWPLAPGEEPTGLAMDVAHRRLFIGCHNQKMVVMNADTGNVVVTLPIGQGVDAVAFDPQTNLAFSSNGDGTLTVVNEQTPDRFAVAQTVKTAKGARTMALDPETHKIYLETAEFVPAVEGKRAAVVPGTFKVLVVDR